MRLGLGHFVRNRPAGPPYITSHPLHPFFAMETPTRTDRQETTTWPELAIGLYDKLTGRGAEITYQFENMEVWVPSATDSDRHAHWKLHGTLRIRTRDDAHR